MAVTASGLYVATFVDILQNDLAIDLEADTLKVAMFTNSITPNFTTDTAYGSAPYNANEVTGTGYSAGGATLGSAAVTGATGTLKFDGADTAWSGSTIASARCALIYDDTTADSAIVLVDFGSDFATTSGTFTITWNAAGIFLLDLTP